MSVHSQAPGRLLGLFLDGAEEGVSEVSFACWGAVRLDVFPEVVVWELEDARE